MANRRPRTVPYRRKREQKTDYKKRLRILLGNKPRLVVRITNQRVIAQLIEFTTTGDKVVAAVDSFGLKKLGWSHSCRNLPAAYLTGMLIAKKGLQKGCQEAVLDTGFKLAQKQGRLFAFLKGVLDGGLPVPHGGENIFPTEERLMGKHLKSGSSAEQTAAQFAQIKQKIAQ